MQSGILVPYAHVPGVIWRDGGGAGGLLRMRPAPLAACTQCYLRGKGDLVCFLGGVWPDLVLVEGEGLRSCLCFCYA